MNNVATLYQACGRYAEAEPLLMEASKVQQRTLGHDSCRCCCGRYIDPLILLPAF